MRGGDHHDCRSNSETLTLLDFKILSALGRGAKGVVFLIQAQENGRLLALKAILRVPLDSRNLAGNNVPPDGDDYESRRICFEKELLGSFCHPLLPKLHGVLVTDRIVAYAIDYCPGRDLNYLRKKQTEKMFSDDIIRFYAAELVLGLEYLHGLGIVYRDLKPENVMIQENGHLMLVDFDLSTKLPAKSPQITPPLSTAPPPKPPRTIKSMRKTKKIGCSPFFKQRDTGIAPEYSVPVVVNSTVTEPNSVEKSNSFVGTEEYVAPEIILGAGHDFAVDWWCLGIVLYEMLYGTTPFRGSDRKDTFRRIISQPPDLTGGLTPLRDLIGKLLEKDPMKRIGELEIKRHDFFKSVNWDWVTELPRPPFIPGSPEVEDMIGNSKIDLEFYVEEVFAVKDGKRERKNERCRENIENNNFIVF